MAVDGAKIGYYSTNQGAGVSIDVGTGSFIMENNLFEGDIHNDFSSLGVNSETGSPLFVNQGGTTKEDYIIQTGSPAIDNGKSFPEPSFPMAGIGIFENISPFPTIDAFGETIDIANVIPNIGASNAFNAENTLGINMLNNAQNKFKLYLNPVKEDINLLFTQETLNFEAKVFDVQGKSIYSTTLNTEDKKASIQLPISFKNGIYFIKINDGTTIETKQFILYR